MAHLRWINANLLHTYHYSSDIIRTTVLIGTLYKQIDTLLRLVLVNDRPQFFIANQARKTIRTKDKRVTFLQFYREDIYLNVGLRPQTTCDHISLCMRTCLIFCQQPRTDLLSNPGMVLRYLYRLSSTDQIGTAITHIRNIGNLATQDSCHASRTHTTTQHVFGSTLINQRVRTLNRSQQRNRDILTIILI